MAGPGLIDAQSRSLQKKGHVKDASSPEDVPESSSGLPVMDQIVFFLHTDVPNSKAARIRSLMTRSGAQEWTPSVTWPEDYKKRHMTASRQAGKALANPDPLWRFDPEVVTHVITCSTSFPEYDACRHPLADGIADDAGQGPATVVSPEWVFRSFHLGARQAERYFSPDPAMIFSGVVVHPSRLSVGDTELILAAVTSLGGHFRMNLTKEVTHVITPSEDSSKLKALRAPDHRHLGIVAVHLAWVNECVRLNTLVNYKPFAWPLLHEGKPACLQSQSSAQPADPKGTNIASLDTDPAQDEGEESRPSVSSLVLKKRNIDELFHHAPDDKRRRRFYRFRDAFKGLKILFVSQEPLANELIETLSYNVTDHGGVWIPLPSQAGSLAHAVARADVVVVSHRDTPAAYWGLYLHKRLATVAWLWWVATSGRLVEPVDNVLHFPPPRRPIKDFEHYTFSLSNYSGETRAYLKDLIQRSGAKWTPNLTPRNTHLIAASAQGEKVARASTWQVTVVNHLWLEACYSLWENVPPSQSRAYTDLSPTVPLQTVMGHARLHKATLQACMENAKEWVLAHSKAEGYAANSQLGESPPPRQGDALAPAAVRNNVTVPESQPSANPSSPPDAVPSSSFPAVCKAPHRRDTTEPPAGAVPATDLISHTSHAPPATTMPASKTSPEPTVNAVTQPILKRTTKPISDSAPQPATEPASDPDPHYVAQKHSSTASHPVSMRQVSEYDCLAPAPLKPKAQLPNPGSSREAERDMSDVARKRKVDEASTLSSDKRHRKSSSSGRRPSRRRQYYATTGMDLSSAEEKALKRRGWYRTLKVDEAGVLLASSLTRTEKMLCAIARGLPVVSRRWIADPDQEWEDVLLSDPQAERARNVDLRAAILHRRNGAPLLEGHTFFFTEHVRPSSSVLRAVVEAAGGEAPSVSTLPMDTIRLNPQTTHLVSSSEDKGVWGPLARERCADGSPVKVWNAELLLDGVLRQEMRWDRSRLLG